MLRYVHRGKPHEAWDGRGAVAQGVSCLRRDWDLGPGRRGGDRFMTWQTRGTGARVWAWEPPCPALLRTSSVVARGGQPGRPL